MLPNRLNPRIDLFVNIIEEGQALITIIMMVPWTTGPWALGFLWAVEFPFLILLVCQRVLIKSRHIPMAAVNSG